MNELLSVIAELSAEVTSAYRRLDAPALDRLFDPDFVFTNPLGQVLDKHQELQKVAGGKLHYDSFENSDVEVRIHGEAAVVVGLATVEGVYEGRTMTGRYRFTRVFVNKQGSWRLVAAQGTRRDS